MDPFTLVTRNAAEVVTEDELRRVLQKPTPTAYIGFEPSGTAHLGWKLVANKMRDLQDAGFKLTVLLADWHAYINDKLGGDLARIKSCGTYMEHAFTALGVDPERATYVYASDYVNDPRYWETVIRVGKATSLNRIKRAMSIMGRTEDEADLDYSKTIYPAMQVADIYYFGFDLSYGGLDQRHAHMLARDVAHKLGVTPTVALHTPLLPSLLEQGGRMDPIAGKMSKSKPDSGIFLHDAPDEVQRKLRGAYCPAKQVEGNPVMELLRLVVFPDAGRLTVSRPAKFGGPVTFETFEAVAQAFREGLHPLDVKNAAADAVNGMLAKVHDHFARHPEGTRALETALKGA